MESVQNRVDVSELASNCKSIGDFHSKYKDQCSNSVKHNKADVYEIKNQTFNDYKFDDISESSRIVIVFIQCTFKENVTIKIINNMKIEFINRCEFEKNVFAKISDNKTIKFSGNSFKGFLEIKINEYTNLEVDLTNNIFYNQTLNLGTAKYNNHVKIEGCEFKKLLPNFRYCTFKNDIDLNLIKIDEKNIISEFKKSLKTEKESSLPDLARDLKLKSASRNDHLREMDFFAIESQARAIKDGGFAKLFSYSYKALSDFGRSFKRPIYIWLGILFFLIIFNSFIAVTNMQPNKEHHLTSVFVISAKTMVPLTLGFDKETVEKAKEIVFGKVGPGVLYQTFRLFVVGFNLILWFLFFFAVRNRFKIS